MKSPNGFEHFSQGLRSGRMRVPCAHLRGVGGPEG